MKNCENTGLTMQFLKETVRPSQNNLFFSYVSSVSAKIYVIGMSTEMVIFIYCRMTVNKYQQYMMDKNYRRLNILEFWK